MHKNLETTQKSTQKYRDSILRDLCKDKERAIGVVNAITGSNYGIDTKITLHDLESSLSKRYNDVAISVENELLVMIEHQSTINPNMPFRLLSYCIDVWRSTFVKRDNLYSKQIHKIPTPKFYILYNGTEPLKENVLSLSKMFQLPPEENSVELNVYVVDINYQSQDEVLVKSDALGGYAYLIEKIREYQAEGLSRDKSIATAIQHCIQNNILQEFLKNNYDRVIDMFNWEHDEEAEKNVIRREAMEQEKLDIAKNLLSMNLSIGDIVKATGLTPEVIDTLK